MRILIEIRGGAFQGATVENDSGPMKIIVCDHDNLEAGDKLDMDGVEYATVEPADFDGIIRDIVDGPA